MPPYRLDYTHGGTIVLTFILQGDQLDPMEVTERLGIPPHRSARMGDPRGPRGGATHITGMWTFIPDCSRYLPFEDQIDRLLTQLEQFPALVLVDYTERFDATITVGLASTDTQFGFVIEPSIIQRLARLQIGLSVDQYYVGPTSETDTPAAY